MTDSKLRDSWQENNALLDHMKSTEGYYSPARFFAERTGVSDVHHPWRMPGGKPHGDVEREFEAACQTCLRQFGGDRALRDPAYHAAMLQIANPLFDRLVALNPELNELRIDRTEWQQVKNALFGITSQFRIEDIHEYVERGLERGMDFWRLFDRVEEKTGCPMDWLPSRQALGDIAAQLWPEIDAPRSIHELDALRRYLPELEHPMPAQATAGKKAGIS